VAKGMDGRDGPLDETLNARTQFDERNSSVIRTDEAPLRE
jgi:hypothetical protein